jgi:hypothetical protein
MDDATVEKIKESLAEEFEIISWEEFEKLVAEAQGKKSN